MQDVGGAIVTSGKVTFDDLRVSHVFSPVTGRVVQDRGAAGPAREEGRAAGDHRIARRRHTRSPIWPRRTPTSTRRSTTTSARRSCSTRTPPRRRTTRRAQDNYQKAKAELSRAQKKAQLLRARRRRLGDAGVHAARADRRRGGRRATSPPASRCRGSTRGGNARRAVHHRRARPGVGRGRRLRDGSRPSQEGRARHRARGRLPEQASSRARVDCVSGSSIRTTRTAKVRCSDRQPRSRCSSPRCTRRCRSSVAERKALAIPRSAMLRLGDQTVVFVQMGTSPNGRSASSAAPSPSTRTKAATTCR